MSNRLPEIQARAAAELTVEDMRTMRTSDIARYRLDIKHLLSLLAERDQEIQQLREASRWIPASERLPERGDSDKSGNVQVWRRADGVDVCAWEDVEDTWDITHWMPLPAPPTNIEGE